MHNVLICASKHVVHAKPLKSDLYETLQKYFGGRMGLEVMADWICYGSFVCSWDGELSLMEEGRRDEVSPCPGRAWNTRGPKAIYFNQWVQIGSTPQLVFYDRDSNTNIISGEMAENEELKILSARAGRVI